LGMYFTGNCLLKESLAIKNWITIVCSHHKKMSGNDYIL